MSLLINKYKEKENKEIKFYLEEVFNSIKRKKMCKKKYKHLLIVIKYQIITNFIK